MNVEQLIIGKHYIYTNHNNEEVHVEYIGVVSDGLTFYKFKHYDIENITTYSLSEYEIVDNIKEL